MLLLTVAFLEDVLELHLLPHDMDGSWANPSEVA